MGIFSRKKNQIQHETISTNPTIKEIAAFFGVDDIAEIGSSLNATTYYACMQIRCNAVAKLPLKVMQTSDDGAKVMHNHDLFRLLKMRPNPFTTAHDFMFATEFQRLEYGDAFWVKEFSKGKITNLYLLDSTKVSIFVDNTGLLGNNAVYYSYLDSKKGELIYREDEVCHFKNFTLDGIKGTPIKKYIRNIVQQEQYSTNVVNKRYKSGLQDPIIVEYAGDLDDGRRAKIVKKFSLYGGTQNAGKVIPIPSDFRVTQLSTKLVDNQFFELSGLNSRNIANAFGVKSFQLNDLTKSTYSNIEQQNRAFYSDTMQNALTVYEQEIDYKLFSKEDQESGIYVNFNVDAMLRSDIESRYNAYKTGIEGGFIKISEVRAKENLPFVPGTDMLIVGNGASIPLDQLGKQYE